MNPTTGQDLLVVAGIVAVRYPLTSTLTFEAPSSSNSLFKAFAKKSCPTVVGDFV
jgi:hypothetical protein